MPGEVRVENILEVLDGCADDCTFPMLDNGYLYLAAARLSLHWAPGRWALVTEVFGFNPRAQEADLQVSVFGNCIVARKTRADFVADQAFESYLASAASHDSRFHHPLVGDGWEFDYTAIPRGATHVLLRGTSIRLPFRGAYAAAGIALSSPDSIHGQELSRLLAATHRDAVLATREERRAQVDPSLAELLVLDDWHHPDTVRRELPSHTETFRQLARVLATGEVNHYQSREPPNTHWKNWPLAGAL